MAVSAIADRSAPGEHASCGPKLQPSGFTYEPSDLMKHKIYHYNFGWRDFGDTSMTNLLDMVKVQSSNQSKRLSESCFTAAFSLSNGVM